jgi:lincosamide nucleotidyltransferase
LVAIAEADDRVVGLVDYGSTSEGRGDRWSDVDCSLFIQPADHAAFVDEWKAWIGRIGPVLLSFTGDIGNHWSVVEGSEFPVRVDLNIYPADAEHLEKLATWPNAPVSVDAMVLIDRTGQLRHQAGKIVGQSLAPLDMPERVDLVMAGFWYYAVRTWCKLQRGPNWGVRFDMSFMMHGNLMALLRLEAGHIERWRSTDAAAGIEHDISPDRLAALNACIPDASPDSLAVALANIVRLGALACTGAAARYHRVWPEELAARMIVLTGESLR